MINPSQTGSAGDLNPTDSITNTAAGSTSLLFAALAALKSIPSQAFIH
jgi:hypothetical protein